MILSRITVTQKHEQGAYASEGKEKGIALVYTCFPIEHLAVDNVFYSTSKFLFIQGGKVTLKHSRHSRKPPVR